MPGPDRGDFVVFQPPFVQQLLGEFFDEFEFQEGRHSGRAGEPAHGKADQPRARSLTVAGCGYGADPAKREDFRAEGANTVASRPTTSPPCSIICS